MPRRIVDRPVAQRDEREAFFARLWEKMSYRVWIVEDDLRGEFWWPLVTTFPALRDLSLDTLYQMQGGPSADRLSWDHYEAAGDGDRARGLEALKDLHRQRRGQSLHRHPRVLATPNPRLNAYLVELERIVTTKLRLQEVKDGRAPNWALLALHAHVSQGESPQYVEFRTHQPPPSLHRQVLCDFSVDFHGARLVCRHHDPNDTFAAMLNETFGISLAPALVDRRLTPPEAETGFNDWKQWRKALHEELDWVADAIADESKQKIEAIYKARRMWRNRYPAQRKARATQDDEPEETKRDDEAPEKIARDDIGALVNWYFSETPPLDPLDRDRLRDIARDQLAVRFPPADPPEIPGGISEPKMASNSPRKTRKWAYGGVRRRVRRRE